jgi:sodium/pantothenate symporter
MNNSVVASWVLISLYMAAILALVIRGARRNRSVADYAVGSFAFSPIAVGLALAASTTSAATFIINPGLVAYFGLSATFGLCVVLPISMSVSLVVLTKGFRAYGSSIKAWTLSQWVGERYKSPGLALFFALLALLLITFIVMILVGLTKVVAASLGLPELGVLAAIVVFSFGYMMFGGANSMVYTNMVQALIMVVVAVLLLGSGFEHLRGGVGGLFEALRAIDPDLARLYNPNSPLFRDAFEVIFCTVVVGAAIVCQPHIITKSLLLENDRDVNRYLVAGIVVQTLFFWVVFMGIWARLSFPALEVGGRRIAPDGVTAAYLVHEFPWFVGVIVFLGLIAAGMSTLEGLIQSLSVTISNDLVQNLLRRARRPLDDHALMRLNRVVIVGLAVASFLLAWRQLVAPNLSVIIFAQLGVYAYFAAAFVPVLFGTFLPRTPAAAATWAAVVAVAVHFGVYFTGQHYLPYYAGAATKNPGIATALGITAALVVGSVIFLIAPSAKSREG